MANTHHPTSSIIARVLLKYIAERLSQQDASESRAFFRLDGFEEAVYQELLRNIQANPIISIRSGRSFTFEPRSTRRVEGFAGYTLEAGRSATFYRNHLGRDRALILIVNSEVSDAQGLQNLFAINESLLATQAFGFLVTESIELRLLGKEDFKILEAFVRTFRKVMSPQLRDIVAFLSSIAGYLGERPARPILTAIGLSLNHLGLFRFNQLPSPLSSSDKLLRALKENRDIASLGREALEPKKLQTYLTKLQSFNMPDDPEGRSGIEKKRLLFRFLNEILERQELIDALSIDFNDVKQALDYKIPKLKALDVLTRIMDAPVLDSKDQALVKKLADDLSNGNATQIGSSELEELGDLVANLDQMLTKAERKVLVDLLPKNKVVTDDFPLQLAFSIFAAIDSEAGDSNTTHTTQVFQPRVTVVSSKNLDEYLVQAFRVLYGGIEQLMPNVKFDPSVTKLLQSNTHGPVDFEDDGKEREALEFEVFLSDQSDPLRFAWSIEKDHPLSTAVQALVRLASPHLTPKPLAFEVAVTTSQRLGLAPMSDTLQNWSEQPHDLSQLLPKHRGAQALAAEAHLHSLWAQTLERSVSNGLLNAPICELADAYGNWIEQHISTFQDKVSALSGYAALSRAFSVVIDPNSTNPQWMIPLLHPLKLHWWYKRVQMIDSHIASALLTRDYIPPAKGLAWKKVIAEELRSSHNPFLVVGGRPQSQMYLQPVEEFHGFEIYSAIPRPIGKSDSAKVVDSLIETEEFAKEIVRIFEDYLATYPYARDRLKVVLAHCTNPSLAPALAKQVYRTIGEIGLCLTIHTELDGTAFFQENTKAIVEFEDWSSSQGRYLPKLQLNVVTGPWPEASQSIDSSDLLILANALNLSGSKLTESIRYRGRDQAHSETPSAQEADLFSLTYPNRPYPYDSLQMNRKLSLGDTASHKAAQAYYVLTALAKQQAIPTTPNDLGDVEFFWEYDMLDWRDFLVQAHQDHRWVVCYDRTVDKYLMRGYLNNQVRVIRYAVGMGPKRDLKLTVSSSNKFTSIVSGRMAQRLPNLLNLAYSDSIVKLSNKLVDLANQISGDLVLRAAGPGSFINELIGLVCALERSRMITPVGENDLEVTVYLDDYRHWFGSSKMPDLLRVIIPNGQSLTANDPLRLKMIVLEAKCVVEGAVDRETRDGEIQVERGVRDFQRYWSGGRPFLDSRYWYDQLARVLAANLNLSGNLRNWEHIQSCIHLGKFELEIKGECWVFNNESENKASSHQYPDKPIARYGITRTGLIKELNSLIPTPLEPKPPTDTNAEKPAPTTRGEQNSEESHIGAGSQHQVTVREQVLRIKQKIKVEDRLEIQIENRLSTLHKRGHTEYAELLVECLCLGEDTARSLGVLKGTLDYPHICGLVESPRNLFDALDDFQKSMSYTRISPKQEQKPHQPSGEETKQSADLTLISNPNGSSSDVADVEKQPAHPPKFQFFEDPEVINTFLQRLKNGLRQYGLTYRRIDVSDVDIGPSVIRFKVQTQDSIDRFRNRAEDLQRVLQILKPPLIENIPETDFLGISIGRKQRSTINTLDLLQYLPKPGPAELPVVLGVTADGRLEIDNLADYPHVLVGGSTGSGKSILLRNLLVSLLAHHTPQTLQLIIADPKATDFVFFDGIPHLMDGKVITDVQEATSKLDWLASKEMPRRQQILRGRSTKMQDFNRLYPSEALPSIVVMIDEYAQLVSLFKKDARDAFERSLMSLAAVARSTGIHLILATQRPDRNIITGVIKANLPTAIALSLTDQTNSRIVIDQAGAENLLGKGDMLLKRASGEVLRLQAPLLNDEDLKMFLASRSRQANEV